MLLSPADVRHKAIGPFVQSCVEAVCANDGADEFLTTVAAHTMDLEIKLNGREVPIQEFLDSIRQVTSIGRADDTLRSLLAEIDAIQTALSVLDHTSIVERSAATLMEILEATRLNNLVLQSLPRARHAEYVVGATSSLNNMRTQVAAHLNE